jgi:alpha-ketoglutarate-dependent taurine dioxygenase
MAVITTERLTPTVGAEVRGVDVERILSDDAFPAWCLDALEHHGVLVFPGLHLDDETQIAWSHRLGTVERFGRGDNAEIFRVSLDPAKSRSAAYLKGTFHWHIDGCTDDIPIMATMLSAHAVASRGGETEFASAYAAHEALDPDERRHAASLRVLHTFEASQRLEAPDPTPEQLELWRRRPTKVHPLVWTHRSGRRSLVLGATADHVVGMAPAEGRALLDDLLGRATAAEMVYRHTWSVGDVVIWDNRGVLHRALPYDSDSPRDMHRTTFTGDEPIQ